MVAFTCVLRHHTMATTISKVLVANRGEISCRLQKACKKLGLGAVAVFTEPDALSLHVLMASESVCLGEAPKEYLNKEKLIEIALATGRWGGRGAAARARLCIGLLHLGAPRSPHLQGSQAVHMCSSACMR